MLSSCLCKSGSISTHTQWIQLSRNPSQNQTRLVAYNAVNPSPQLKPFVDALSVVQLRTALSSGEAHNTVD